MQRLYGSDDLFPDDRVDAYHAWQSVNYVTSHDGFTLYDLVSYNAKRNGANGHDNRDGTDDNLSWNCGWEGDEGAPPEVLALREATGEELPLRCSCSPTARRCCAAGDELLHTQGGNNNPYNQDNETSWLDWGRLDAHRDVFRFVAADDRVPQGAPVALPQPVLARRRALVWPGRAGGPVARLAHVSPSACAAPRRTTTTST